MFAFRSIVLGCVLVLVASMQARTARADTPAEQTWAGFYVGLQGGYAWGDASFDINAHPIANNNLTPAGEATFLRLGEGSDNLDGFIGGGQAGFNVSLGAFVVGIEADLSAIEGDGRRTEVSNLTVAGVSIPATFKDTSDIDWLATVRGRIGGVFGKALIYGTAGLAIADVSFRRQIFVPGDGCPSTPCHDGSDSATMTGWTIGGGVEYVLDSGWSVKAEYLFVELRDDLEFTTQSRFVANQSLEHSAEIDDLHLVRAGLNYRF